jgi:hypothetical protein
MNKIYSPPKLCQVSFFITSIITKGAVLCTGQTLMFAKDFYDGYE